MTGVVWLMLPFCTSWIYFLSVAFRAWVVHHLSGRWNLEFLVVWIGVLLVFIGVRCITGGRFWGGKGLESQKDVLEENELVGVKHHMGLSAWGTTRPNKVVSLSVIIIERNNNCTICLLGYEIWFCIFYLGCGSNGL